MTTAIATENVRRALQGFDFRGLFIEELGWDAYRGMPLSAAVGGETYTLRPVAEKRGMTALLCEPDARGGIPDNKTRKAIEAQVTKLAHEHVIIYVDKGETRQIWQWVKRQQGRPNAYREWTLTKGQTGEALAQRLRELEIALDEEERLTLPDVTDRAKRAFDVDRVTKRFYDRFKTEHAAFLKLIEGIADEDQREWYASLMLNRLMFTYFVQKKGFLANDTDYLRTRLGQVQARYGSGKFHTFYRDFLLRFFHEGLGLPKAQRTPDLAALIGDIPYVNGGLFELHQIEAANRSIAIPDEAFERVFDFFDGYNWHLDDRPLHADNEINPDVLGYIFEKYINQKQMGAYYTKEDITGYIGRNTILPYLFDAARKECPIAFEPDGEVWRLLRDDPDRYIYVAVCKGVDEPLPPEIEAGVDDVAKRGGWNKPAPEPFALPTETWREHMARRTRCLDLRAKLAAGEVTQINDLITYNLDIERFARDVIDLCEGPELLRAFWKALTTITIVDPTCGSGAFLFAALNLLEPLYEACLERMESFVAEFDRQGQTQKAPDFHKEMQRIDEHANRRYFILKTIIIKNLYGVDIMAEACEIAKLRLFLKLVAQVENVKNLEPLPDIDFNIRAGNTLIGFASYEQVHKAITSQFDWDNMLDSVNARVEALDTQLAEYRAAQAESLTGGQTRNIKSEKEKILLSMRELDETLNGYLASTHGVDLHNVKKSALRSELELWRAKHQPLHWFVEFHDIMRSGGFSVIVGNPPYVEYSKVRTAYKISGYETEECGNLYAMTCERSLSLVSPCGRLGLIIPLSFMATERMSLLRRAFKGAQHDLWLSSFDVYPSKLFDGAKQRLTIIVTSSRDSQTDIATTSYMRWKPEERDHLFGVIAYQRSYIDGQLQVIPKIGPTAASTILGKFRGYAAAPYIDHLPTPSFYVHRIPYNYVKALDFVPYFWNQIDGQKKSEDYKPFYLRNPEEGRIVLATLNSNLFFWWWYTLFEGYHCGRHEVYAFPVGLNKMTSATKRRLVELADALMDDMKAHAVRKEASYKATGKVIYDEFYPRLSKTIIDEIDRVLARHYAFSEDELDYLINYDIKYRLSGDLEGDE